MNKHELIQFHGLELVRDMIRNDPNFYHYTIASRIDSIRQNGLVVGSNPLTSEGCIRGIYFTNDDRMNYHKTMHDSANSHEDVYRIHVNLSNYIDHVFIDSEFYPTIESSDDMRGEIEAMDGELYVYIDCDLSTDAIVEINHESEFECRDDSVFSEY